MVEELTVPVLVDGIMKQLPAYVQVVDSDSPFAIRYVNNVVPHDVDGIRFEQDFTGKWYGFTGGGLI